MPSTLYWKYLKRCFHFENTFSVHTKPEKLKNLTICGHFSFVFEETRTGISREYRVYEN